MIGDIVTYPGSRAIWEIISTGTSHGRTLSNGYREPDWHWVELKHADGSHPGFSHRVSSDCVRPALAPTHKDKK